MIHSNRLCRIALFVVSSSSNALGAGARQNIRTSMVNGYPEKQPAIAHKTFRPHRPRSFTSMDTAAT